MLEIVVRWLWTSLEMALATVLLVAGASKGLDLQNWRSALWGYRIHLLRARALVLAVPLAELTIGIGVGLHQPTAELSAGALFLGFATVLGVAYRRGARGGCDCFGSILRSAIGPSAIARAAVLAMIAGLELTSGLHVLEPGAQLLASVVCAAAVLTVSELRAFSRSPS